jgi:hypothetical protein
MFYYQFADVNNFNNNAQSVPLRLVDDPVAFLRRQVTIEGLQNGRRYSFYCSSSNRIGFGQNSQPVEENVGVAAIQPYNVRTVNTFDFSGVEVLWDSIDNNCPGWAVTGCFVSLRYERSTNINGMMQT